MAMTPSARATAIYNKIAGTPNFGKLSSGEQADTLAAIQNIWGDGDLVYIQGNADVLPAAHAGLSLNNPAGQPVATTGTASAQTGATTAPEAITGMGSLT